MTDFEAQSISHGERGVSERTEYETKILGYYQSILPFTTLSSIQSIPVHNCYLFDSIFERIDAGEQVLRGRTKRFLHYLCFYWHNPVSKEEGSVFLFHTIHRGGIGPDGTPVGQKEANWSGWNDNIIRDTTKYYRSADEFLMDFFRNPNIKVDPRIRP